jgi:hypothetical protein
MKYPSGRKVAVGDHVKLWSNQRGVVVCSIDTKEFTHDYPKEEWEYLGSGIIIKTDSGEIFHYTEPDEDFEFIKSLAPP